MYQEELKITKERIPILIGKNGTTKKEIERKTNTKLKINSTEGDIDIFGEDSLDVFTTKKVCQAISRGFNPEIALNLLHDNITLDIVELKDFAGKNKTKQIRIKSRIIGTKGKCKRVIENLTHTEIVVYGKTVSIIGNVEDVITARRAVEMILKGSKHGNVYSWLEKYTKSHKEEIA